MTVQTGISINSNWLSEPRRAPTYLSWIPLGMCKKRLVTFVFLWGSFFGCFLGCFFETTRFVVMFGSFLMLFWAIFDEYNYCRPPDIWPVSNGGIWLIQKMVHEKLLDKMPPKNRETLKCRDSPWFACQKMEYGRWEDLRNVSKMSRKMLQKRADSGSKSRVGKSKKRLVSDWRGPKKTK